MENAQRSIDDMLGGTVFGNILNVMLGFTILILEMNASDVDAFLGALIKVGSFIVIYFGIRNGHLAYKRNKIELKKLENDQRTDKQS